MTSRVTEEQLDALRRRRLHTQAQSTRRAALARAYLPQMVRTLVERFGATRIVLFGSLARGNFNGDSDVDVAVENLPGISLFQACAQLNGEAPVPVDLKPLEDLSTDFRERAFKVSEVLYDKSLT